MEKLPLTYEDLEVGMKCLPDKIYKYTSFKTALKILKNSSLKFTSPSEFNDPYDCQGKLKFIGSRSKMKKMFLKNNKGLSVSDISRMSTFYSKNPEKINTIVERSTQKQLSEVGVFCASEVCDSVLMWSYYADSHKGVCIEIDRTFDDVFSKCLKVEYLEKLPTFNIAETELAWLNKLYVKAKCWEHEKEIRFIQNMHGFYPISKEAISKIIVGINLSRESIIILKNTISSLYSQIEVLQMRRDATSFKMLMERV